MFILMKENEFVTFCNCGCGNGIVLKADNEDEEVSLQIVSDSFYIMQDKGKMSLREKIKRIWYIVKGKEYCYFDILIGKDELQKFKEFVEKI